MDSSSAESSLTLPAVLAYLESTWRSYNEDRTKWEGERSHLQSTISLLKGEREGQQALQRDLVRRIKMLEFALREERKKNLAKSEDKDGEGAGSEQSAAEKKEAAAKSGEGADNEISADRFHTAIHRPRNSAGNGPVASPGRDRLLRSQTILRKYLDQMGYTDALISTPIRHSHLKSNAYMMYEQNGDHTNTTGTPPAHPGPRSGVTGGDPIPSFASRAAEAMEPREAWSATSTSSSGDAGANGDQAQTGGSSGADNDGSGSGSGASGNGRAAGDDEFVLESASTTTAGEEPAQSLHKQWKARTSLRSHFDAVRALAFDDTAPLLLSASEDCTLKLWPLRAVASNSKRMMHTAHIEPLFTFRGHSGPVYTCALNSRTNLCFSGGADTSVMAWSLPDPQDDPYSTSGAPTRKVATLVGHTDAVWDLSHHPFEDILASTSADGTVRLFDVKRASPLVRTMSAPDIGTPATAQFITTDPSKIVAGYVENSLVQFDVETGEIVLSSALEGGAAARINRLTTHPTQGLVITAHEDATIQFFDLKSGKIVHNMRAHTDGVSSVSLDSGGLYLASAGHDCSVRFWDLGTRSCVQELSIHRPKYDAGIHDTKFHPTMSFVATAGADSSVKIYQ